jgi:hypothetical protein
MMIISNKTHILSFYRSKNISYGYKCQFICGIPSWMAHLEEEAPRPPANLVYGGRRVDLHRIYK